MMIVVLITAGLTTGCQGGNLQAAGTVRISASQPARAFPVGTAQALQALPGMQMKSWQAYTNPNEVLHISVDPQGNIWTAGPGGVSIWKAADGSHIPYTSANGLPGNAVTALAIDRNGLAWAGTQDGSLAIFDGSIWKPFGPRFGEIVTALSFGTDGAAWVGTNQGLVRFNARTGAATTTHSPLPDDYIHSVWVTTKGPVWAGVMGGVFKVDGDSLSAYPLEKGELVSAIAEAADGTLWFASGSRLVRYDGVEWITYQFGEQDNPISAIQVDAQGNLWLLEQGRAVAYFDTKTYSFTEYLLTDGSSLAMDAQGTLWLGTFRSGIASFDGKALNQFTAGNEPARNALLSGAAGTDGSLWIGTDAGVSRFDGKSWQSFSMADGLSSDLITAMAGGTDGSLWLGTDQGLSQYLNGQWQNFEPEGWTAGSPFYKLVTSGDGSLWAVTRRQLFRLAGDRWNVMPLPVYSTSGLVQDITGGAQGGVWVTTSNGPYFYNGGNWVTLALPYRNRGFRIVQSPNGDLWVQVSDSELLFVDGRLWDALPLAATQSITLDPGGTVHRSNGLNDYPVDGQFWQVYGVESGLPDAEIYALSPRSGRGVWALTEEGIYGFDGSTWSRHFDPLGTGSDRVSFILEDDWGNTWIGLQLGGLIRYTP